jgi:type I restriction enzyme, R subunit
MENPTVVVITDRNDLDGQLFGVFSLSQELLREQPVQGETRQDLRTKLANRPSGGIIFATIQKFMPGEDEDRFPILSERSRGWMRTTSGLSTRLCEPLRGEVQMCCRLR